MGRSDALRSGSAAAWAATIAALGVPLAGCASDATASPEPAMHEQPLTTCPPTLADTNGRACDSDGTTYGKGSLVCTIPLACGGAVAQQIRCTCDGARFACVDESGPIAVGADARCVGDAPPQDEACPSSLLAARGRPCAQLGHACHYKGATCPDRPVQNIDTCECRGGADGDRTFVCTVATCNPFVAEGDPVPGGPSR